MTDAADVLDVEADLFGFAGGWNVTAVMEFVRKIRRRASFADGPPRRA
jgi:hypothetical protein